MAHCSIAFAGGMSGCRTPPDTRRAPREHSRAPTSVTRPRLKYGLDIKW